MESMFAGLIVAFVEAIFFRWIWGKKHTPLREATAEIVKVVRRQAEPALAREIKRSLDKNPKAREVLDVVIAEAHANVPN